MSPEPVPSPRPVVPSPRALVPPRPTAPQCPRCNYGEPFIQRLEKGNEAYRAGQYEMAAELFRSMLAGLAKPDRNLCLRLGDALARAGRLPEALGAFRGAERLGALRPEELGELACGLARAMGLRERRLPMGKPGPGRAPVAPGEARPSTAPPAPRVLLGCPRCRRLLYKPVTLPSGVTVCKRCVDLGSPRPQLRRVNVVLSGLVERCFPGECRLRKLAGQARNLQRQQQLDAALLKCEQALDLGKSALGRARLVTQPVGPRAELGGGRWHEVLKSFVQA